MVIWMKFSTQRTFRRKMMVMRMRSIMMPTQKRKELKEEEKEIV
jgi:hypothetical protein